MNALQVMRAAVRGEAVMDVGAQGGERHLAKARQRQRLGILERPAKRRVDRCSTRQPGASLRSPMASSDGQPSAL